MSNVQRLGLLGLVALMGVAWAASRGSGTAAPLNEDAAAAPVNRVEVKTELINVAVVAEPAPNLAQRRAPALRPQPGRTPVRADARPGKTGRALRALLGDGRYRPEPFPTVKPH